jgi:hypothetical protein
MVNRNSFRKVPPESGGRRRDFSAMTDEQKSKVRRRRKMQKIRVSAGGLNRGFGV